jgi:hypothetical protein
MARVRVGKVKRVERKICEPLKAAAYARLETTIQAKLKNGEKIFGE